MRHLFYEDWYSIYLRLRVLSYNVFSIALVDFLRDCAANILVLQYLSLKTATVE